MTLLGTELNGLPPAVPIDASHIYVWPLNDAAGSSQGEEIVSGTSPMVNHSSPGGETHAFGSTRMKMPVGQTSLALISGHGLWAATGLTIAGITTGSTTVECVMSLDIDAWIAAGSVSSEVYTAILGSVLNSEAVGIGDSWFGAWPRGPERDGCIIGHAKLGTADQLVVTPRLVSFEGVERPHYYCWTYDYITTVMIFYYDGAVIGYYTGNNYSCPTYTALMIGCNPVGGPNVTVLGNFADVRVSNIARPYSYVSAQASYWGAVRSFT
jgi:hypothetical protein